MVRMSLICLVVLGVCSFALAGEKKKPAKVDQGLVVQVVKLKGNFMPGPGGGNRGNKTPLQVPVHIFKGKVQPFEKPDPKHKQLVKIVKTNVYGLATVALEPGTYTAVAEIDGKLYLNIQSFSQGKSWWATTEVKKDKLTRWTIEDSSDAAF